MLRKICNIKRVTVALAIIAALQLAACGNEANTETQSPQNTQTQTPETQVPETQAPEEENDEENEEETNQPSEVESEQEDTSQDVESEQSSIEMINFSVTHTEVFSENFNDGETQFTGRGSANVEITTDEEDGTNSLRVSGRTGTWNGPMVDLSGILEENKRYRIEAWVMLLEDAPADVLKISTTSHLNDTDYVSCSSNVARKNEWTKIDGMLSLPPGTNKAILFFETSYRESPTQEELSGFYLRDVLVSEVVTEGSAVDLPPLYEAHEGFFSIGIGVTPYDLNVPERAEVVKRHFNSITMGNEMKPDSILDYSVNSSDPEKYNLEPAIHTRNLDIGLKFAQENDIKLRAHTLVWHSQTPRWFFKENYSNDPEAPYVSREVMLARLESYIKQVIEYCQTNFPGIVYCYDVVNEAIDPGDDDPDGIRVTNNPWYDTVGPDYVEMAFTYARKYAAPDVQLFYNDYNCFYKNKLFLIYDMAEKLVEKGIIDGIGMQGHIGMSDPSITDYQYAVTKLGELGLEIQITELDIGLSDNSEEELLKLGSRYKRLMTMFRHVKDKGLANITNVTVWGLTDDGSWLNNDTGAKYPLLFDMYLHPKDAFFGFALHDSIPLY